MGNYKYIEEIIDKMVCKHKPFLLIKYGVEAFNGVTNNVYEVVTLGRKRLQYITLDRRVALNIINKYDLPILYKMDSRNIIYGDENFRDKFKEKGVLI